MKFALALLVAAVYGQTPDKAGTPCEKADDTCGDAATMCCGVATGGKMCKTADCKDTTSTNPVPNFVVCNNKTKPEAFTLQQ